MGGRATRFLGQGDGRSRGLGDLVEHAARRRRELELETVRQTG
jgi:hypothetical protein